MIDLDDLGDRGVQFVGLDPTDDLGGGLGGGDFNGDGIVDLFIGAPGGDGKGYVILGSTIGIDTDLSNAFLTFQGTANGRAGTMLTDAGDIDGDGINDLLIGALLEGVVQAGAAYVVFGRTAGGSVDLAAIGSDGFRIAAANTGDDAGSGVLGLGDINNDGFDDYVVGAFRDDTAGNNDGAANVIFGLASPTAVDLGSLGSDGYTIYGRAGFSDGIGKFMAAGDLNGDGLTDVALGSYNGSGRAGVVFGTDPVPTGSLNFDDGDNLLLFVPGASNKTTVAVGDFDGDGQDDLVIGAPRADTDVSNGGRVLGAAGSALTDNMVFDANDDILRGDGVEQRLGTTVANLGDVNGDGIDDLVVGSRGYQAVVLFGHAGFFTPDADDPITNVDALDATLGFVINGANNDAYEGETIAGPGDVNGDGLNDILIGSYGDLAVTERVSLVYGAFMASATDGADALTSGFQADSIAGAGGDDTIFGNGGNDTLMGEDGNDLLAGGGDDDSVSGGDGNDNAYGQAGNDTLRGGAGSDNLRGNPGQDMLDGDAGDDTLRGHLDGDTLLGDDGDDLLFGGAGDDSIDGGAGNDTLNGNSGNDTIVGGTEANLLRGQGGADSLIGNTGNDTLRGMQGFDTLIGGDGDDFLNGGAADDVLRGGAGADIFEFAQFQGGDTVTDFDTSQDLLSFVGFGFADLVISDTDDGARITIAAEGDSPTLAVLLTGIDAADLNAGLFIGG